MPADLLFEIGTEEIPAGFLMRALPELEKRLAAKLEQARLAAGSIRVTGTPRRLVAAAAGIPDRQPDLEERVVGPPAKIAFDDDGNPTKAALGFAKKNGVDPGSLSKDSVPGKKGEYLVCTRREEGREAAVVLAEALTELIAELPWPKSMRWAWTEEAFARPVHWIVARLGDHDLDVQFAGVRAASTTRGHRFLAPGQLNVTSSFADYEAALRGAFVIVDRDKRKDMVEAELLTAAKEAVADIRPDPELIDEVADLVEYPVAVRGEFDSSFLEVPEEVIVSAMRSHQRYFALEKAGCLVNQFITISGTVTSDAAVVRRGNEKVLAARLSDAQFFFREDRKKSLDAWAAQLSGVVFQAKLGTIGDKVARFRAVATSLADAVGADREMVARACDLAKADLVTHLVGEFPDLQGTMGRHYAKLAGEDELVCRAIEEHYLPRGASDSPPSSDIGAVVGIADRIDTLVGCFAAGLAPSGSADPYALRRAAVSILTILLDRDWSVSLGGLIRWAAEALADRIEVSREVESQVHEFLRTRLRGLISSGDDSRVSMDCVDAALAAGANDVPDARRRAQAISEMRRRDDFEPLAQAIKRVANILKGHEFTNDPDPEVFVEGDERDLWSAFGAIERRALDHLSEGNYQGALQVLVELKAPVDRFFDSVLVMDENAKVRENRLALLGRINSTFSRIADFKHLST